MNPKISTSEALHFLATEFHVDVAPAKGLQNAALRAWIEEAEDTVARLFRKMSYMRNCTAAERSAAYGRFMDMRGLHPLPEDVEADGAAAGAMNALFTLDDFPVLASLARERTQASKLDGRACRHLYLESASKLEAPYIPSRELALMRILGVRPPVTHPILVIDLEATCDEGDELSAEHMEIIEIGAVWATVEGKVLDTFQSLVRPVVRPQLTPFCRQLVGIDQVEVDAADLFPVVAARLASFAQLHQAGQKTWGSWGKFDATQLARDCERHGATHPLQGFEHVNLKRRFAKPRKIKEVGMARALQMVGLELDGSHHRGLDDARNIAKLLPWCPAP